MTVPEQIKQLEAGIRSVDESLNGPLQKWERKEYLSVKFDYVSQLADLYESYKKYFQIIVESETS